MVFKDLSNIFQLKASGSELWSEMNSFQDFVASYTIEMI